MSIALEIRLPPQCSDPLVERFGALADALRVWSSTGVDFDGLGRDHALHGGHIAAAVRRALLGAAAGDRRLRQCDLQAAAREEASFDPAHTRRPAGF